MAKQLFRVLLKIKMRFYISAIIILTAIAVTPTAIEDAYNFRGYEAIGGEYLIIPLGIFSALAVLQILYDNDKEKERRKKHESKRYS